MRANPFQGYENEAACVYFVHFEARPPEATTREAARQASDRDEVVFADRTAYLYIPGVYGQSTPSGTTPEKKLGVAATMRSFNTMLRLVALAYED